MSTKKAVSSKSSTAVSAAISTAGSAVGSAPGGITLPGSTPVVVTGSGVVSQPVASAKTLTGLRASLSAMAQGWSTVFPSDTTLPSVDGGYAQTAVVSQIDAWLALYPAVDSAKLGYTTAVAQLHEAEPAMRAMLAALKTALKGYFKPGSPQLVQFGMKPAKPRAKLSGAKLAVRAVRAEQTRQIRGTMSAKQKAALKSQGPLVSQVVPPAQPAAAPAVAAVVKPTTSS